MKESGSRLFAFCVAVILMLPSLSASDPTSTNYTSWQCEGSLTPYRAPEHQTEIPDTLTPVYINHVGRHGARYPASATHCVNMLKLLQKADSAGTLTETGLKLKKLVTEVIDICHNQWGALDSLGMAEQRGIASRMFLNYPRLFENTRIEAISSYAPRCMMSMFSFVHQLDRLNNRIEVSTLTGRVNSALMRPFDIDQDYIDFRKTGRWSVPYDQYAAKTIPLTAIGRVVGERYRFADDNEAREMALNEYYVIAGLSCMSVDIDASLYFTNEEYNALWSCFNLRQYLQRTATTISTVPADIASPLLLDLISTTEAFIAGKNRATVNLRFGHAETLMPLLSLMHLKGCYYMTNYFDTVALHWCDFNVVPMAANLQMVLFKSKSGRYYVRVDVNETAVPLLPNSTDVYTPWNVARDYLTRCVPLYYN